MKFRFRSKGVDGLIIAFATTIQSIMEKGRSDRPGSMGLPKKSGTVSRSFLVARSSYIFYAAK